ncbi:MAG: patatin-like phospholipase family protein [Micrococcales bacterium]|nr:patatin-like phospholipase family protein [Micrococcales bacterium]
MDDGRRVALSLGAGGARGYAHIGVLQVLAERGHEVVSIAGTSMGALVGGIAAAGKLEAYTEWAVHLTQREVWRLFDLTLSAPGAIRAERVFAKVSEILGGVTIEALPIPFTAVATDLRARREVWFQRGPLDQAIRASTALPGFITPVMFNGRLLVDGGLMNPVPIEPLAIASAELTVAVSLTGDRVPGSASSPLTESSEPGAFEELAERLRRGTAGMRESERLKAITHRFGSARTKDGDDGIPEPTRGAIAASPPAPADIGLIELLTMSLDTMSALITRYRMAANPPDVLVTIPANAARVLDFHRAAEMIELGRRLTTEALDKAGY